MKLKRIITIPYIDGSDTPARVHKPSGTVFINKSVWGNYSNSEKRIILLHEEGHYILQTSSEEDADNYALNNFAGSEDFSLKKTFNLLFNALDRTVFANQKRLITLAENIAIIDYQRFGNEKALKSLKIIRKMKHKINLLPNYSSLEFSDFQPDTSIKRAIFDAQARFLVEQGITDLNSLSEQQRFDQMVKFLESDFMEKIIIGVNLLDEKNRLEQEDYSDLLPIILLAIPGITAFISGIGSTLGIPAIASAVVAFGPKIIGLLKTYGVKLLPLAKKHGLKKAIEMAKNLTGGGSGGTTSGTTGGTTGGGSGGGSGGTVGTVTNTTTDKLKPDAEKKKILGMSIPVFVGVTAGSVVIIGLLVFLIIKLN